MNEMTGDLLVATSLDISLMLLMMYLRRQYANKRNRGNNKTRR